MVVPLGKNPVFNFQVPRLQSDQSVLILAFSAKQPKLIEVASLDFGSLPNLLYSIQNTKVLHESNDKIYQYT